MEFISPFVQPMICDFIKGLTGGGCDPVIPSYDPTLWLNNMGQINSPTPSTTKTNTRTSTATAFDHEGIVVTGEPGEFMLDGGRPERNLATSLTTHSIAVEVGRTYQISCEGANASTVVLSNAATGTLPNNGVDRLAFNTAKTAATNTLTLTVTGALTSLQVQDVTGRSNTAPSEHILATTDHGSGVNGVKWYPYANGNTVLNNVVTEAPGTAITPAPQVLMQPQRTNLIKWSRDLTNAAWSGAPLVAKTEIGLDGASNTATLVTDNSTSALQFLTQAHQVAATSAAHAYRVFIRKESHEKLCGVAFDVSNRNGFYTFNRKTGELGAISADISSVIEVNDVGFWWEVISQLTSDGGNTLARAYIVPAYGNTKGIRDNTATGSIIVGNVEFYENKTIEQIRGTPPIFTEAAPVTVDNDLIEIADFNNWAPTTSGIMLFAFTPSGDWAALGAEQLVYGGASANLLFRSANDDGLKATDGTSTPSILSGHTPGTEIIASVYWDATLNIFQIGYYEMDNTTQHWDASPATFTTLTVAPELIIAKILDGAVTIRGLQIFNGMPASGVDRASIEAWIEANQEAKINERMA